MEPSVANLVGMLSLLRPDSLRSLAASYPDAAPLLRPGTVLGDGPEVMSARRALAVEALHALRPVIQSTEATLFGRLRTSARLELGGALVALVGSGSTLALLAGNPSVASNASVAAGVALLGSLLTLAVRFMRRDVLGTDNALQTQYSRLRDADWQSKMLISQLEVLSGASEAQLKEEPNAGLIRQADELAGNLYRTLKDLGIAVRA